MKNALKLGAVVGVVSLAIGLILPKVMGIDFMFSWKSMVLTSLFSLVLAIFLGIKWLRPDDGDGTLYYGEALKYLFVAMFVSSLISMIPMSFVYGNDEAVEEAFQTYMHDTQVGAVKMTGNMMGKSEDEIQEMVDEIEDQMASGEIDIPENPFSLSLLPMNILTSIFSSLIMGLIAAIFVKKTK